MRLSGTTHWEAEVGSLTGILSKTHELETEIFRPRFIEFVLASPCLGENKTKLN